MSTYLARAIRAAPISLLALFGATPTQAAPIVLPILINATETITWQTPSFDPATFTGNSMFSTGSFDGTQFFADGTFGSTNFTPGEPVIPGNPIRILIPGNPIVPGEAIVWQLGGTANTLSAAFVTDAFPDNPFLITGPPIAPPFITIALDLMPGFAPIDLSGPIFAFDAPEQIGTWEVSISEAVPEPATLPLLASGLAGLALVRRRRATVAAQS